MNRTLEVLYKIYKPFRITKVNKCILMRTMDGDYVIKSMSIPLAHNGTMTIQASKAIERI